MPHVAELSYPGRWLDHEDHERCLRLESHFHHLERYLAEAAISLDLFEAAIRRRERAAHPATRAARRHERVLRVLVPGGSGEEGMARIQAWRRAEEARPLEEPRDGRTPETYAHLAPYVHARAFLGAMEEVGWWLAALDGEEGSVGDARQRFSAAFPRLRIARGGEYGLLRCEPVRITGSEPAGEGPPHAGPVVLEVREGRWFALRFIADQPREVEVSADSLLAARDCVQAAIRALPWRGPCRLAP